MTSYQFPYNQWTYNVRFIVSFTFFVDFLLWWHDGTIVMINVIGIAQLILGWYNNVLESFHCKKKKSCFVIVVSFFVSLVINDENIIIIIYYYWFFTACLNLQKMRYFGDFSVSPSVCNPVSKKSLLIPTSWGRTEWTWSMAQRMFTNMFDDPKCVREHVRGSENPTFFVLSYYNTFKKWLHIFNKNVLKLLC